MLGVELLLDSSRDRSALRVALAQKDARPSGEHLVVLGLEASQTVVVDANEPECLARQLTGRVEATKVVGERNALELELGELVGLAEIDLARDVDEARVLLELRLHATRRQLDLSKALRRSAPCQRGGLNDLNPD